MSNNEDYSDQNIIFNEEFVENLNAALYESPSSILFVSPTSINTNSIKDLKDQIKENTLPYQDKDKIPEIKLKDENYLESGDKIETYIKNPINNPLNNVFIDSSYNICEGCKENNNYIFCKKCQKNLCDNCSKDCETDLHDYIELQKLKNECEYYSKDIMRIISEYFIKPEEKEKNNEKVKKSYKIIDEDKIIDDKFADKCKIYTNDILLIESIIGKNYNNYYHYKNIKNCYRYMQKKYDINNCITVEYLVKNEDRRIKIFDYKFVENNKVKCLIICEEDEFELTEYFEVKNYINNNILKIKLIGINNIINMEDMFYKCYSLKSLSDISKWKTNNVNNMSGMFYGCRSLESLSDISKWNTSNVTNMESMFRLCSSLKSLPDISNWNTTNVTNMEYMFYDCCSLESLPDISNWITSKVTNMEFMFYNCHSLKSLPDLSKWNIGNAANMENMFRLCFSLSSLPDFHNGIK